MLAKLSKQKHPQLSIAIWKSLINSLLKCDQRQSMRINDRQQGKCWLGRQTLSLFGQRTKVETETGFFIKRKCKQDLTCFGTKQMKIELLGERDVAAVVFRPNGHFSELAYSLKRLSLFLKINPCRPLNWDTKTTLAWVNICDPLQYKDLGKGPITILAVFPRVVKTAFDPPWGFSNSWANFEWQVDFFNLGFPCYFWDWYRKVDLSWYSLFMSFDGKSRWIILCVSAKSLKKLIFHIGECGARGVRQMKSGILAEGKVAIVGKAIVGEMSSDSLINHEQQSQE